ncbi:MAG: UDP-N-acetylmuramoyl-L-alanyl-D-glutamate--2,6-diaminopimelate ligase [Candidatus Bipolaricaulota bacterium]|nr:UDP-N-acetylmuramoyl-L-alanyl-D-glutamate--2,6-diaminopimelate ligase [Candidatus Bipolaricaulota bacterium]
MSKRLGDLASDLGIPCPPDWSRVGIEGVTDDSRAVSPGVLFVAHRGTHDDGHAHVADAVARGAAAVVAERDVEVGDRPHFIVADGRIELARWAAAFYGHPTERLRTVGVTGTNGKTSVCHFVAHLVGPESTEVVGTVENLARGLRALTTPPSPAVQRIAREAVDQGKTILVLEASSIGLDQHRLDEVAFDVGVFTNLTRDHLDLHGTIDAYGAAKAILFRDLSSSAVAVLNADDPYSETLRRACRCRVLTYGVQHSADLKAEAAGEDASGITLSIQQSDQSARVVAPVHGLYGASNALAALGAALALGVPWSVGMERLQSLPAVTGRWNLFRRPDGADAIVDFAHTPDGLFQILSAVRRIYGKTVIVFGCAGGSDRGKRGQMGEIASRFADVVVLTQDNPKYEEPEAILDEIEAGIRTPSHAAIRIVDRREAIENAARRVGHGDVLLLAGKGHETFQIVRGEFLPHSDAAILESLGFAPVSPGGGKGGSP